MLWGSQQVEPGYARRDETCPHGHQDGARVSEPEVSALVAEAELQFFAEILTSRLTEKFQGTQERHCEESITERRQMTKDLCDGLYKETASGAVQSPRLPKLGPLGFL